MSRRYESWGRFPQAVQQARRLQWRDEPLPWPEEGTVLPYGLGRSYGDSCLNDGGTLLDAAGLDHFMAFDAASGVLRCEAGVSLEQILRVAVPRGWFPPVTPGTKHVTVGGAIANDVHGKNHHRAGSFGRYVRRLALQRSDDGLVECSPEENAELFAATVGGLGLTGLIVWAELQLRRVPSAYIDQEVIRFGDLEEFFRLAQSSDGDHEYTVAWVDVLAPEDRRGRGLFIRGNHASAEGLLQPFATHGDPRLNVPADAPAFVLNPLSVKAFNTLYYHRVPEAPQRKRVHYEPFFYPLDAVGQWNRLYGKRGFLQYQFVVPHESAQGAVREILNLTAHARSASFLSVLKAFGDAQSPGMLSFPRPGVTLALDFPNNGRATLDLLQRFDEIVAEHRGAVYPAKDARMGAGMFQRAFPRWREFARHVDPRFSSSFWRRVTADSET